MNVEMKEQVVKLLEGYTERERQIALLHYEMLHTARVSSEEVIDSMSLGHNDGMGGSSRGHISNKTMYIALNYQERMECMNGEVMNELAMQLLELESKQKRLNYYVSLLERREADVIRLTYFEGCSQDTVSEALGVVPRTMRRIKKDAIKKLTSMYDFAENTQKKQIP